MAKAKTMKAQVTVSVPRAGEFNLTLDIPLDAGEMSAAQIQAHALSEVTGRLKVKVTNVADLSKKLKAQAKSST